MLDSYNIYLVLAFAFAVGASMGSFVTLASHRLPLGEDIVFKPSRCPACHASLRFPDLFPVLSWLAQRGRCRYCRGRISLRYPLIELALGAVFAFLAFRYGTGMRFLLLALLATELAILVVTDLEHYIIPDSIQLALFLTGIAYRLYAGHEPGDIAASVISGLVLGLMLHYGYFYLRGKDGLGFGDVKLLAVAGAWLPITDFVPFLLFSGLAGILTGLLWRFMGRGAVFPFGPALAFSLFINVLFPDMMMRLQGFFL